MHPMQKEVAIRSIKLLDIGWATSAYFLLAILAVFLLDKVYGKFNEQVEGRKSTARIVLDIIVHVWFIGVLAYIVRNLFPLIPWPFEGVYGYKHAKTSEVTQSALFVAFVVTFDKHLQQQVSMLKSRILLH
jgi:MFS family permease